MVGISPKLYHVRMNILLNIFKSRKCGRAPIQGRLIGFLCRMGDSGAAGSKYEMIHGGLTVMCD